MFEKLKAAYIKARYSKHYRINDDELALARRPSRGRRPRGRDDLCGKARSAGSYRLSAITAWIDRHRDPKPLRAF